MGKRDLTRPGVAASAHQDHGGGRVMRETAAASNSRAEALGAHRVYGRRLQGFLLVHGRQDPGEGPGQHGLAGAARAHHQTLRHYLSSSAS